MKSSRALIRESCVGYFGLASLPITPERNFEAVRRDLEDIVARLRRRDLETNERQKLLRELRWLLQEADNLNTHKLPLTLVTRSKPVQ